MFGFLRKKSRGIQEFERQAFNAWRVTKTTPAHLLRLRLAFGSSTVAIAHDVAGDDGRVVVEPILAELKNDSRDLAVTCGELFDVDVPEHSIDFSMTRFLAVIDPQRIGINRQTKLNGLAAMEGLFSSFGQEAADWVDDHRDGPFGSTGAAALFMHDIALGGRSDGPSSLLVAKAFAQAFSELTSRR